MAPAGPGTRPERPRLIKRLLWFIALWIGGVATIAVVGLAIKLALRA